jgi:hypothetical protein
MEMWFKVILSITVVIAVVIAFVSLMSDAPVVSLAGTAYAYVIDKYLEDKE